MRYALSVLGGQISNLSRFRAVYFKKNEKEKKRPWGGEGKVHGHTERI